ncbi:MmpS family transport accessory protein [Nocardia sp. NPDC051570]|uniref:MmpS family transport accessory protein n=1 Tax=Nocardia sp. NPDC051570 TaxID=3364324 RepID=UPI0037B3D170
MFSSCAILVSTAGHEAAKAVTGTSSNLSAADARAELQAHNSPAPATGIATRTTIPPLTADPSTGPGKTIVYEVVSNGSLSSVTYFDALSAEQQDTDVPAPWSMTVDNTSTYPIAGLGAQTNGTSVTCRITVDGAVADEKTSTGQYAVVDCSASVSR